MTNETRCDLIEPDGKDSIDAMRRDETNKLRHDRPRHDRTCDERQDQPADGT